MAISMNDAVYAVQQIIGLTFSDPAILWEALQAPGSGVRLSGNRRITSKGNKRMALAGDAHARSMVADVWYKGDYELVDADEFIKELLCNDNLIGVCESRGIHQYINLNPSSTSVGRITMADTMKAILCAAYGEGSYLALQNVMGNLGLLPQERR